MNPMLLCDAYKLGHMEQYPEGTTLVYSNFTARNFKHMEKVYPVDKMVFFGLSGVLGKMVKMWDNEFFDQPYIHVKSDFQRKVGHFVKPDWVGYKYFEELHELGYLPLKIMALPEGSKVGPNVPVFTIENELPQFFWLTNFVETYLSAELWKMSTAATIANVYREILLKYARKTGSPEAFVDWQGHDFSYRGLSCSEDAAKTGAAHLTSFLGTDTPPAIDYLFENYDVDGEFIGGSVPACYDDQTEILTDQGWKLFKDVSPSQKVAQYHPDGTIDFVIPSEYYNMPYNGPMVCFSKSGYGYVDMVVTPNHKMIRLHNERGLEFFEAGDFSYHNRNGYSHRSNIIVAGKTKTSGNGLTAIDRLKIAFQADGALPSHAEDYNGKRSGKFPIRFSLKKERKKERLVKILEEANLEYTLSEYDNDYYSFWINCEEKLLKDFSWVNVSEISYDWAKEFIEELQYWDGSSKKRTIVYSSINQSCVDKVHAIASISGYKGQINSFLDKRDDYKRQTTHSIVLMRDKYLVSGNDVKRTLVDYSGNVHCVSVPTKMLLVRRNGRASVCGNTEHSCMSAGGKDTEFETYERLLTKVYPSGIVSIVSDTWDLWNVLENYLPRLKDVIMNRTPDALGFAKCVIRPDSGDPVHIICGNPDATPGSAESKGVIECLWDVFGGTITSTGHKLLDSHIGAIYGDSITPHICDDILDTLEKKGFASADMVFGNGSFTYNYTTRDTLGFAMKATLTENGSGLMELSKDPITDLTKTKKSAKGLLSVVKNEKGDFILLDQLDERHPDDCLSEVEPRHVESLKEIRARVRES